MPYNVAIVISQKQYNGNYMRIMTGEIVIAM